MQASLLDDLNAFIRARMAAAAHDKTLYDRNSARLNSQLLQGEINMGSAVLAWLDARQAGASVAEDDDSSPDNSEGAGDNNAQA